MLCRQELDKMLVGCVWGSASSESRPIKPTFFTQDEAFLLNDCKRDVLLYLESRMHLGCTCLRWHACHKFLRHSGWCSCEFHLRSGLAPNLSALLGAALAVAAPREGSGTARFFFVQTRKSHLASTWWFQAGFLQLLAIF